MIDFRLYLSQAELSVLIGLVRRARSHAQRRFERRHNTGTDDPAFRKARKLRDLLVKLLEVR